MRLSSGNEPPLKHSPTPKPSRSKLFGLVLIGLVAALVVLDLTVFRGNPPSQSQRAIAQEQKSGHSSETIGTRESPSDKAGDLKVGRELAQQVCGSCHIFPEPEVADRFTWANGILPRMNEWLGYHTVDWTNEPGGDQVIASGKVPNEPIINFADLKIIHSYYLNAAPLKPPPQVNKSELKMGLKQFRVRKSTYRNGRPMTTLVKIDERSKLLFVGDGETKKLAVLKSDGTVAALLEMPNPIVHLLERPDGFYASVIGSVFPSDLAQGQLVHLQCPSSKPQGSYEFTKVLLSELRRPVECAVADLNQDGREDLVVATYGNVLGRFSWYEQKPDGSYSEHVLLDRSGAVGVKVHDFDGDGRPDIVVTMAQAQEGISLFLNRGQGRFEESIIVQKHPAWGFTHLELVDFNKDGKPDLLVANGDNGDNVMFPHCVMTEHFDCTY